MADEPLSELGGITPLMAAHNPEMDKLAELGQTGRLKTIPDGMYSGSEVAIPTILGYDLYKYEIGRGAFEAAGMGITLRPSDIALRCNFVHIKNGKIYDPSAGHIPDDIACKAIQHLNEYAMSPGIEFYHRQSHCNLLVLRDMLGKVTTTPPHTIIGQDFKAFLPESDDVHTAKFLSDLIYGANECLSKLDFSLLSGYQLAIWPWAAGRNPLIPWPYVDVNDGRVIAGVPLVRGIGHYAGLRCIDVDGATGYHDTDYKAKADAAIRALDDGADFVVLHIESCDEASHEGNVSQKIQSIESISKYIVAPILDYALNCEASTSIALLPDHPTSTLTRSHLTDAVPFVIYRPGCINDDVITFDETSVAAGSYGTMYGTNFIKTFLAN